MTLTQAQTNVLAHVVVNPTEWVSHAVEIIGEEAVLAKISTHEAAYNAAVLKEGADYKNRTQRDATVTLPS